MTIVDLVLAILADGVSFAALAAVRTMVRRVDERLAELEALQSRPEGLGRAVPKPKRRGAGDGQD